MDESKYREYYIRLSYECAIITFLKKDGTPRMMLCTRDTYAGAIWHGELGGMLNAFDKRNNMKNGNISVIDLEIGECRSFNVERLSSITWLGTIANNTQLSEQYEKFKCMKKDYDESVKKLSMEDIETI